jgi:hypothetical protein
MTILRVTCPDTVGARIAHLGDHTGPLPLETLSGV